MIRASGSFNVNQGNMHQFLTGPQSHMVRFLRETTRQTVNAAKTQSLSGVPVRTGQLRNSMRADHISVTGMTARTAVVADKDYAAAVHDGSKPHIIRPRNKKALAFKVDGRTVFVKEVKHPGAKPNPFLLRAARRVAEPKGFIVSRG